MYKILRNIIFICILVIFLTASASVPELFQSTEISDDTICDDRETEVLYDETERSEGKEEEQAQLILAESVMTESTYVMPENEEEIKGLQEKLDSVNTMLDQITSTYSEENTEIEVQISEMLEEINDAIKPQHAYFKDIQEQYDIAKERLNRYVQMLQSIRDKMETIKISGSTDMSKTFGFTEEELIYILKNVRGRKGNLIIADTQLAEKVAKGIVEAMAEYPVNELFAISVMSFESGYFKSVLATKYNNFGGMQKPEGEGAYHFATPEEGIMAAVKCIHSNLRKNNTANDVNEKYCSPHITINITYNEEGEEVEEVVVDTYYWARNVLSIMKSYARGISKFQ